jgi:outer membrane protein TolC
VNRRICWTVLVFTLVTTRVRAADPQSLPNPLSLAQALTMALSNSSILRTAQSQLEQATGRDAQFRSALLPQVDINARQAYLTINLRGLGLEIPGVTEGVIGPFGSADIRVGLHQDLLNIASLQAWKSARLKQTSGRLLVDDAREVIALNVVAAYLQALRAKASKESLIEQIRLANDLYKLTQDRVKQGVSAPLETIRAQQQVNSLEQQRQEAEQSYATAKLTLANVLQTAITSDYEVEDASAYGANTALDRHGAVDTALTTRPDYQSAQADVKAAELRIKAAKASRLPTIDASFSDGQSGASVAENVNTYRLQGSVNIPIFTGGRIRGEIDEAEGALHQAQASATQLRLQIETDVLTALAGVEWALKEVETSSENVTLSRQEVDLSRQRFSQGITDNTEVVDAQDRVNKADDARVRAMYTLGLARANLARAMGTAEKTYRK